MIRIEIIFKRNIPEVCFIGNFEEYYCTDKMFFIKDEFGGSNYFSLDEIFRIKIFKTKQKEDKE